MYSLVRNLKNKSLTVVRSDGLTPVMYGELMTHKLKDDSGVNEVVLICKGDQDVIAETLKAMLNHDNFYELKLKKNIEVMVSPEKYFPQISGHSSNLGGAAVFEESLDEHEIQGPLPVASPEPMPESDPEEYEGYSSDLGGVGIATSGGIVSEQEELEGPVPVASSEPMTETDPEECEVAGGAEFAGDEVIGGGEGRKTYCIFCNGMVPRLGRHLERKHRLEPLVIEYMKLPAKGIKRRRAILDIKRLGLRHLATKNEFIQQKRPNLSIKKEREYIPCLSCKGLYLKETLYRHYKRCIGISRNPKYLVRQSMELIQSKEHLPVDACQMLKDVIFPGMHGDEVLDIIKGDMEILNFGNDLCLRHASEKHLKNHIRAQMRLLGSLVLEARKINRDVKYLKDLFNVKKWAVLIQSIQAVAGYDVLSGSYKSPTVVNHIGLMMTHVGNNIRVECGRDVEGIQRRDEVQHWLDYFKQKYNNTIGRNALKVAARKKWEKGSTIPVVEDITRLNRYLNEKRERGVANLKNQFDYESWKQLASSCMLQLLLFNRKRVGEVEKLLVTDYSNKKKTDCESDIYKTLEPVEKMICKRYHHMLARGKLGRPVPILVEETLASSIDVMMTYRDLAGVDNENPYLFGSGSSFFNGSKALEKAAEECGAKNPQLLKSTALRKHMATIVQTLCLKDSELRNLAGFLGHTSKTNLEFYRLPSDAVHTAKLSRLLEAFNSGNINIYKGKSLDEIPPNILEIDIGTEIESTPPSPPPQSPQPGPSGYDITPKKSNLKIRWSTPEKKVVLSNFRGHIVNKTLPSYQECDVLRKNFSCLRNRSVQKIKAFLNNYIKKQN